RSIRRDLATALPFWPLGLPGWTDEWLALGMRVPDGRTTYLSVWRRGGETELRLRVGHLAGRPVQAEVLHPVDASVGTAEWDGDAVRVSVPRAPGVLLVRLTAGA
ncbi:MAG: alpha-galactosidase, partial [Streptomyces sp.]|nr:alpha-galactosidase [Streptomyces sp.]